MSLDLLNLLEKINENGRRNEEQTVFNTNYNNINNETNCAYPSPVESSMEFKDALNYLISNNIVNGQSLASSTIIDPISVSNSDGISNQSALNNFISGINLEQNVATNINDSYIYEQKMALLENLLAIQQLNENMYDNSSNQLLENESPISMDMSFEDMLNDIKNNGASLLGGSFTNEQGNTNSYDNSNPSSLNNESSSMNISIEDMLNDIKSNGISLLGGSCTNEQNGSYINEQSDFNGLSSENINELLTHVLNMLQNENEEINGNNTQGIENTQVINDLNSLLMNSLTKVSEG